MNYCRNCYERYNEIFTSPQELTTDFPKIIHLNYDYTCSQRCIFCRDEIKRLNKKEEYFYNLNIDSKIIPLLKNAEILSLNGNGEVFDSYHSKLVIKKVTEKYPNLKLELWSNGINITEENIIKLNIKDKIKTVHISVNAGTEKTYKKIFRSNNFNRVKQNIIYLTNLKAQNRIEDIHLSFVINEVNYRDMKKFMQFAKDLDVSVSFSITHPSDGKFTVCSS